jgi:hypothetical protein
MGYEAFILYCYFDQEDHFMVNFCKNSSADGDAGVLGRRGGEKIKYRTHLDLTCLYR